MLIFLTDRLLNVGEQKGIIMIDFSELPQLLQSIVVDLERLGANYHRAGLLDEASPRPARRLLGEREEVLTFRRLFLLTDALLRNVVGKALLANGRGPWHVAVFGGTQVGKSTCVNVLLGSNTAEVHHTGGFTRHAQGFTPPWMHPNATFGGNPFAFCRFVQVPREQLNPRMPWIGIACNL